jgi:integrase
MRGHVRKRRSGWVYVIDVGRDENGKRKQKWSRQYPTRKEAERELRRSLGRVDVGQDPFPERIGVTPFVERVLDHWRVNGQHAPSTTREYERLLRQRVLPLIGGHELAKVRPAHVQHVIDAAKADGVTPTQLRAVMHTAFEMGVRWSLIPVNPVTATAAKAKQRPKLTVPDAAQLRQLIDVAVGTPWEIPMLISATCGTRREETLGVTWSCVDLDKGTVRIERGLQRVDGEFRLVGLKTERSKRTIPLPSFAVERLRAHKAAQLRRLDWNLVCAQHDGGPMSPNSFTNATKRFAARIGLPEMRLHDIRHGVATALAKSGARPEVTSALMGHSSVTFTANVYTHPDAEQLEAAMRSVEQAFGH